MTGKTDIRMVLYYIILVFGLGLFYDSKKDDLPDKNCPLIAPLCYLVVHSKSNSKMMRKEEFMLFEF